MKNLRVNEGNFKRGIKYTILPLVLATVIVSSSGCSLLPNGNNAKYKESETLNVGETISSQSESSKPEEYLINVKFDDLNIPLKDILVETNYGNVRYSNYDEFRIYLDSINTFYEFEDVYDFDSSLNEYNKTKIKKHSSNIKILNSNELYNIVLNNNKKYKDTDDSAFLYKEMDNSELKKICDIIIEVVNYYIENNSDIDKNRIFCVLNDLKIYNKESSLNNAEVTDSNCLVLSPSMLEFSEIYGGKGTSYDVIIHEIIHLLQKNCNCDIEQNSNLIRNFGINYKFKNLELNSLNFNWLYEASAEKEMANYTGHGLYVYKNKVGYLESLSVTNILNSNFEVNDTEKLSFKRNLNSLFELFNASTTKEQNEILNMMYTINIMQEKPEDFYLIYEKMTGIEKNSEVTENINLEVKSSICQTLTKFFYKNLAYNIQGKTISYEDIFYLISVFENDINSHIDVLNESKYKYNKDFLSKYVDIQDNFFYTLSKNSNYSQKEIENMFNNYTSTIKNGASNIDNYSLDFIDNSKKKYLEERRNSISDYISPTFRQIKDRYLTMDVQKVY